MTGKEAIREAHRRRRAALTAAEITQAGAGIASHGTAWAAEKSAGSPAEFAIYLGVLTEPPTFGLIAALAAAGHRVLLPVCEPGRHLSWVYWTPATRFARSRYAPVDEPEGERLPAASTVAGAAGIFLPATALDRSGNRIGQGGGYYDRLLDALDRSGQLPATIAVVYDDELLPAGSIPAEPLDRRVASALTPSGIVELDEPNGAG